MKKWNVVQNAMRLLLVLLLAVMVFVPPMTLKLNMISANSGDYLLELSSAAYSDDLISEEEYERISEAVSRVHGSGDEKSETSKMDQVMYAKDIEIGDVESRFAYSQSLFSAILSLPDTITLIKGDMAYIRNGAVENLEDEAKAINENSVQTFMLTKMVLSQYSGVMNVGIILYLIVTILLFVLCFVITPLKFLVVATKEIISAVKGKREWLYQDNADKLVVGGRDILTSLGTMLFVPLFLRGSTFTPLYFIAVVLALIWVAAIVIPTFMNASKKYEKQIIIFVAVSIMLFAAGLIVAVILGEKLLSYDALIETYTYENLMNLNELLGGELTEIGLVFIATIPRVLVAFCFLMIMNYVIDSLVRLVIAPDGFAMAKYIRFIFVALVGILYGQMTSPDGMAGTIIGLSILLFSIELGYSLFRNAFINSKDSKDKDIEGLLQRLQALKDEDKLDEEGFTDLTGKLKELTATEKLSMKQRMEVFVIEKAIGKLEQEKGTPKDTGEEKT